MPDSSSACSHGDPTGKQHILTNGTTRTNRQVLGYFQLQVPLASQSESYTNFAGSGAPDSEVNVAMGFTPNTQQVGTGAAAGSPAVIVEYATNIGTPISNYYAPYSQSVTVSYTQSTSIPPYTNPYPVTTITGVSVTNGSNYPTIITYSITVQTLQGDCI